MNEEIFFVTIKKSRPLRNLKRAISRKFLLNNSSRFLEVNDQMVVFSHDIIAHHINLDGFYEKEELEFIFSWFETLNTSTKEKLFNGNALDVGANIGNHSLYFSKYFQKVYSFEPHPKIFKLLQINSELRKNIEIENIGLSNVSKASTLFFNNENMGASSLDTSLIPGSSETKVQLKKIDDLENIGNITFLKIDVEGHEDKVIEGSKQVIIENQPFIMFEQFPSEISRGSSKTLDLLKTMGYKKFGIMESSSNLQSSNRYFSYFLTVMNIISRLIFGKKVFLKIEKDFSPKYYQFILAIPGWISEKENR